jgi:hypothetical protein
MKRQNNIFLNIGLKNCPIEVDEIIRRLNYNGLTVSASMTKKSQYNGRKEKTLVIYSNCSYKFSKVIQIIEDLCTVTNQDCIALKYNLNELIIYNQFKNIEPIKFENKYFKTLTA